MSNISLFAAHIALISVFATIFVIAGCLAILAIVGTAREFRNFLDSDRPPID